jgi:hypothetical protein
MATDGLIEMNSIFRECGFVAPHICSDCELKIALVCELKGSCLQAATVRNFLCGFGLQGVLPVQGNTTGVPLIPAAGAIVLHG